jgi:hypothetical protein
MLDMWSRFFIATFFVVGTLMVIALITIPPGILCFYMGWSLFIYEYVTGVWTLILSSWVVAYLFVTGKLQ